MTSHASISRLIHIVMESPLTCCIAKRKADEPLDDGSPKRLKQASSPSEEPEQKPQVMKIIPFPEKVRCLMRSIIEPICLSLGDIASCPRRA